MKNGGRAITIDRNAPEWTSLNQLFGCYLYQSFDMEYPDAWAAVDDFRRGEPDGVVRSAASAARRLVATTTDDTEALEAIAGLGSYYYPPGDDYTGRGWLVALADFLEAER